MSLSNDERTTVNLMMDKGELQVKALEIFHRLWGRDVDHIDYNKDDWCMLQTILLRLGVKV